MELSNIKTVKNLLDKNGFSFKKSLGQNFLINPQVCPQMAAAACDGDTGVIEIGPGIGVLTAELSKKAKRVIAIELDDRLKKILPVTLDGCENVEVIYGDAMKLDLKAIICDKLSDCSSIAICANLPYYITSPMIMMLLESKLPINTITVMVQLEAAERLCAQVGSRQAGAVTATVTYYAEKEILFQVGRESFIPAPKVDSAVIQLKIREKPPVSVNDEKKLFKLIRACFAQRRKTLLNTVSSALGIDKNKLRQALDEIGLEPNVRGEQLNMEQLAKLSDIIEF